MIMKLESRNGIVIFDAYAWIEYALDGAKADAVETELEFASEALTPASVIAELKESMLRHGITGKTVSKIITFIKSKSSIAEIDSTLAELAGEINFQHKRRIKDWGMMDSMVFAASISRKGSKILTGDPHFKGLSNVIYIGK